MRREEKCCYTINKIQDVSKIFRVFLVAIFLGALPKKYKYKYSWDLYETKKAISVGLQDRSVKCLFKNKPMKICGKGGRGYL